MFRIFLSAVLIVIVFTPPETGAGGLPEPAPLITTGEEKTPEAEIPHPAAEPKEEPDFPPEVLDPGAGDFTLPADEPEAPRGGAARLWVLPVLILSAAAALILMRVLKGGG